MAPDKNLFAHCAWLFLLSLTACAPLQKVAIVEIDPEIVQLTETGTLADQCTMSPEQNASGYSLEDSFLEENQNETYADSLTEAEPEQTVSEEVAELATLGDWNKGLPEIQPNQGETVYDFPITINRQVEFYLEFFQGKQRESFSRWLARSGRYLPMIQEHLRQAGMPLDLAYLPMIESGFSLTAYSKARAVGPWQFIKATACRYGLTVNDYVDERRDPEKATRAAIAYLRDLYERFHSWPLAVAAYNAGEGKIAKAIRKYDTEDFWQLAQGRYLKLETKRYVPKLIAAIILARNPEKYGFTNIEYEAPLKYDTIAVPRWTSLQAVAVASGEDLETIHNLNRELRRVMTPPSEPYYQIKVPDGAKNLVALNLPRVHATLGTSFKTHVVKKNESIDRICRKYNLSKTTLLKANNLRSSQLTAGQCLRIPYRTTQYILLADNEQPTRYNPAAVPGDNLILHKVKPGETISDITRRYNVPGHLIASWNDLADLHFIKAGQQLALYLEDAGLQSAARRDRTEQRSKNTRLVLIATKKKIRVSGMDNGLAAITTGGHDGNDKPGMRLTYYHVQGGDSLWTIARKYKTTTDNIKMWNQLDTDIIQPGRRLLLKVSADADLS